MIAISNGQRGHQRHQTLLELERQDHQIRARLTMSRNTTYTALSVGCRAATSDQRNRVAACLGRAEFRLAKLSFKYH